MERTIAAEKAPFFIDNYFFSKARFLNMGFIRIFIPAVAVVLYPDANRFRYAGAELLTVPTKSTLIELLSGPFSLIQDRPLLFQAIYLLAAACSILGLFTRPALFVFGLFSIYTSGLSSAQGVFNHGLSLLSQVIFLLASVPGVKSLSLDRFFLWLFKLRKTGATLLSTLKGPAVPVWGYKLIIILLACTYFTSGLSKVRYGGLQWLDGKTLTHLLDGSASPYTPGFKPTFIGPRDVPGAEKWKDGFGIYAYSYGNRQANPRWIRVGQYIAAHRPLIQGLSILTVAFEMAGFVLLVAGWPRTLYLLGAVLMHTSIGYLMSLPFTEYRVLCLLLIDWTWVFQQVRGWRLFKRAPKPAV